MHTQRDIQIPTTPSRTPSPSTSPMSKPGNDVKTPTEKKEKAKISMEIVGFHLVRLRKEISESNQISALQAKFILSSFEDGIVSAMTIIKCVGSEIQNLDLKDTSNDKDAETLNTAWNEFSAHSQSFLDKVKALSASFSNKETTDYMVATQIHGLIKELPLLLSSFNGLKLNKKFKSLLPNSFDDVKNAFAKIIDLNIKSILPPGYKDKIDNLFKSDPEKSAKDFKNLPIFLQDVELIALQTLNSILRNLMMFLDKLGIQLSINDDSLTKRKIEFLRNESLHSICERVGDTYIRYMTIANYPVEDELYPYPQSIHKQRVELLENTNKEYIDDEEKAIQADIDQARKDSIELLNERMEQTSKKKKPIIDELIKKLSDTTIHLALKEMETKKLDTSVLKSGKTAKTIKSIEEVFAKLEKYKQQRIATRNMQIKRIEARIQKQPVLKVIPVSADVKAKQQPKTIADIIQRVNEKTIQKLKENNDKLLYMFTGKKPRKNSVVLEEVKLEVSSQSKPDEHSPPQINVIDSINAVENELKNIIDADIYNKYFGVKKVSDKKEGISYAELDAKLPWIESLGNSFDHIRHAAISINTALSMKGSKRKRGTCPADNMLTTIDSLEQMVDDTTDMITSIFKVAHDPFVQQFTSVTGIKSFMSSTFSSFMGYQTPIELTSTFKSIKEQPNVLKRLEEIYSLLTLAYQQDEESKKSVATVTKSLNDLLVAARPLNEKVLKPTSNTEIASFVWNNKSNIILLLKNFSQTLTAFKGVAKESGLKIIQEINLVFRDLFLMLDKLEIQFYLREGYLSTRPLFGNKSVHDFMIEFHHMIHQQGYEFSPDESYPYTNKIQEQRSELLAIAKNDVENKFIEQRIQLGKVKCSNEAMNKLANKNAIKSHQDSVKYQATLRIDSRIKALELELTHHCSQADIKNKKIKLLNDLLAIKDPSMTVDQKLDFLNSQPLAPVDVYQLYEGRTGQLIRDLQLLGSAKNDLLNRIDLEIIKYQKERDESYYFFADSTQVKREDKIYSLQALREVLNKEGYALVDATENLKNSPAYKTLKEDLNPLLQEMLKIDSQIPADLRGKIRIHTADNNRMFVPKEREKKKLVSPKKEEFLDKKHSVNVSHPATGRSNEADEVVVPQPVVDFHPDEFVLGLITKRIAELQGAWVHTNTNVAKTRLLQSLKQHLETHTLSDSLKKLRETKSLKSSFHLLFEGRTGEMMKTIQSSQQTPDDIIHRIDLEISKLKEQRTETVYFFAQNKKITLEKRIQALSMLKKEFLENRNETFAHVFQGVSNVHKYVLLENDATLIEDLQYWQKTRVEANKTKLSK